MWVLTGLLIGSPLGFALQRSDFCMHSAFRESLAGKPGASVRAYLLALGVQMAAVNSLAGLGLTVPIPPVDLAPALFGGLVFGVGMVLAKG
jgi:uncharacterized membrane protein YedE/YeeE